MMRKRSVHQVAVAALIGMLVGASPVRADSRADFDAWSAAARKQCDADARKGGRLDGVLFHRCMVDAHERSDWVTQERIERCREKSGALWGNREGESDESLWNCLAREGKRYADSGGTSAASGAAALQGHDSPERARARRPACEDWARDNLEPGASHLDFIARCMYSTGSPAAVAAAMNRRGTGDTTAQDAAVLPGAAAGDNPVRAQNRAWCAEHNAGGDRTGLLRYDCSCVDSSTAMQQRARKLDDAAVAARRFDLSSCVDRSATAERVVADMGGRTLGSLFDSDDDIRTREACYRRAVGKDLKAADLSDDTRLRDAVKRLCR
jgi:hypothetical protein